MAPAAFSHLFSPIRIRGLEIRNRILSTGHDTTLNGMGLACLARTTSDTQSPVPTGTVDLLTMISGARISSPMVSTAWRTYCRSASPSTPSGVPTAMKAKSAPSSASV